MPDSLMTEILEAAQKDKWTDSQLEGKAVELAEAIQRQVLAKSGFPERHRRHRFAEMVKDRDGMAFAVRAEEALSSALTVDRQADYFRYLFKTYGMPKSLNVGERLAFHAAYRFSEKLPATVKPVLSSWLNKIDSFASVITDDCKAWRQCRRMKKIGLTVDLHLLSKQVLGENEAHRYLQNLLDLLARKECQCISVSISSLYSQLDASAFEETIIILKKRLSQLYRAAMNPATGESGEHKMVILQADSYRDFILGVELFKQTLNEDEFLKFEAGIALPACYPISVEVQMELLNWSKERAAQGGSGIIIRLEKGENVTDERICSAVNGWPFPVYDSPVQIDSQYKRLLLEACRPAHVQHVKTIVATHDLFELCYALLLRERAGVRNFIHLEVRYGLQEKQLRLLLPLVGPCFVYTQIVEKEYLSKAHSYAVKSFVEQTLEGMWFHDAFDMTPGNQSWNIRKKQFLRSCHERDKAVSVTPGRFSAEKVNYNTVTDWTQEERRNRFRECVLDEKKKGKEDIPMYIHGKEITTQIWGVGRDSSRNLEKTYRFAYAGFEQIDPCLSAAELGGSIWAKKSVKEKVDLFQKVAHELEKNRGEILAAMVRDVGKRLRESDLEFNEAIDSCRNAEKLLNRDGMNDGVVMSPFGIVCVLSTWKEAVSQPVRDIVAALMCGNPVIFNPSEYAVYVASFLMKAFRSAGIPPEVLQLMPIPRNEIAEKFFVDLRLKALIVSGRSENLTILNKVRKELKVHGVTTGVNTMLISSSADRDQAIRHLVRSAFDFSGQSRSSVQLALVEASLYDHPHFLADLKDAVASLIVGDAWSFDTRIHPLRHRPLEADLKALTELEAGEEWLLKPEHDDQNPCLWSPGIRLGVKPGSLLYQTACGVPVLGVMRVESVEDGVSIQNEITSGLLAGFLSQDERELEQWKRLIRSGNIIVNGDTCIRPGKYSPVSGWGYQHGGMTAKTDGPNFLTQFGIWEEHADPKQLRTPGDHVAQLMEKLCDYLPESARRIRAAAGSQAKWWFEEFGKVHEIRHVAGYRNEFRYVPIHSLLVRTVGIPDDDLAILLLAAKLCGVSIHWSVEKGREWLEGVSDHYESLTKETEEELLARLENFPVALEAIRIKAPSSDFVEVAARAKVAIIDQPILANGRLELLHMLKEQTIVENTRF